MPCSDGREREDNEDNMHMREGADILCSWIRTVIRSEGTKQLEYIFPKKVLVWWEKHKERDRLKEERGW